MLDIGAEGDLLGFLAGEEPDRSLVEPSQLFQLQGIDLPLPSFHERQGGPRDAKERSDLVLRETEVLPRFTEPFPQRLRSPSLSSVWVSRSLLIYAPFGLLRSAQIILIRSSISSIASSTLL